MLTILVCNGRRLTINFVHGDWRPFQDLKSVEIVRRVSKGILLAHFGKQFCWNLWVFCHLSASWSLHSALGNFPEGPTQETLLLPLLLPHPHLFFQSWPGHTINIRIRKWSEIFWTFIVDICFLEYRHSSAQLSFVKTNQAKNIGGTAHYSKMPLGYDVQWMWVLVVKLFCRYIGRSYIAIARQDKIYRNISNALSRTNIYRNISDALRRLRSDHEYFSLNPNTLQWIGEKIKNGRLK